jgi:hypothetical protein
MKARNQKTERRGRLERAVLRTVMVAGLAVAGVLGYATRGDGEKLAASMSGMVGVAVVGGVSSFGRVRARRRWEAAWDAYAKGR